MAQQLGELPVLMEDLGLVPTTPMVSYSLVKLQFQEISGLFWAQAPDSFISSQHCLDIVTQDILYLIPKVHCDLDTALSHKNS